jgi:TetR/AcrR family transcriptional regulator, transcriptional repressor for nem operon
MSKGEETRQRIVAQAAAMFNQHGFDGSSLSELMKATGLEKGGIYRHFSSKEELAAEAFDYAWKAAWDARMRDLDSIANSVDKLKQLIANFVSRRTSVPGGCPLLNTAIDADDGNPVLRESAVKALGVWRALLVSIITAGKKRKEIRPGVDPAALATLIISSLEGALMVSRLERDPRALQAAQAHLEHYMETDVRQQKRHDRPAVRLPTGKSPNSKSTLRNED